MGAKRVSKQGVTVSEGNAIEVTNTAGTALFSVNSTGNINTLANLTAKGSILTASAANTPAALAVGNAGDTLVADSSQTTGLRYNPPVGSLANPVINGGFDIWQRGTSISFANLKPYAADRWQGVSPSGSTNATFSRQTVNDSTNLPNIQYAARLQRAASNSVTSPIAATQSIETANSIPLAGKAITLSFYARRGANFSGASNELSVYLYTGTGTDQNINGTWTGLSTIINNQKAALTTTWQRFAFTANVASTATEMGIEFTYTPSGTAGADDWFEITGVQVDVGTWTASTAPTFRRSGGTLAGELAACQRYYYRNTPGVAYGSYNANGIGFNATSAVFIVNVPVPMRTNPSTTVDFSGLALVDGTNSYPVTGTSMASTQTSNFGMFVTFNTASGLTQYRPYIINNNNNANGYLGFSAEL